MIGFIAALGIGALAAALVFGTVGVATAATIGAVLVARRRRRPRPWKSVALLPPRS
jgi:hypothetical protein